MGDRVLNFSEFADKYSSEDGLDVNDITIASDNFKNGFDDASYDSPEIKPNRPVKDTESFIPGPDEDGAPSFTSDVKSDMIAPTEEEEGIEEPSVEIEDEEIIEPEGSAIPEIDFDEDGGNPEEEDEEDDEEEDEEEEEEENEEEETNESVNGLLESFDSFNSRDFQDNSILDDSKCIVICKSCGSEKEIPSGHYPFGIDNELSKESWWQGSKGMQCGCNA